jgi:hypothetical protein
MALASEIRRVVTVIEDTAATSASGTRRRVAALAVVANPLAGKYEEDLAELVELGGVVAEVLADAIAPHLDTTSSVALGRAAVVGQDGELEHAAMLIGSAFAAKCQARLFAVEPDPPSTRARIKPASAIDVGFQSRVGKGECAGVWRLWLDGHPKDDEAVVVLALCGPV